ncbi:hypothetical protein F4778DRAFT_87422 [Xylariomycetidae sp. FL2044]|nr:hypothetical protein F4778DRAFT_87422 [Xylariomycetidae sp. FL2044]
MFQNFVRDTIYCYPPPLFFYLIFFPLSLRASFICYALLLFRSDLAFLTGRRTKRYNLVYVQKSAASLLFWIIGLPLFTPNANRTSKSLRSRVHLFHR